MHSLGQRRRRVLIVVSSFSPVMIADMQRARMLAWELPKFGWDVEVLTPAAGEVRQDAVEPDPNAFFSPETTVHEVGSFVRWIFELLGSRTHAWRTYLPMRWRGDELVGSKQFDLVYFTTTTFIFFTLGPRWKRRFGVPYIVDFHDPWVRERSASESPVPWRTRVLDLLSVRMEKAVAAEAAGIVAVSFGYLESLRSRYFSMNPPWLSSNRNVVIPFGALETDLLEAGKSANASLRIGATELPIRYIGAGGAIMARSFRLICGAIALLRAHGHAVANNVRIRLYGTMYGWKSGDPKLLESIAMKAGIGDLVEEMPGRVSYRRSLELLLDSDGVLILGVDDAGYMPSKLFSYALSGKPLLASLRRDSPAFSQLRSAPEMGQAIWFDETGEMPLDMAAKEVGRYLEAVAVHATFDRRNVIRPFLASEMSRRHTELFEACLNGAVQA